MNDKSSLELIPMEQCEEVKQTAEDKLGPLGTTSSQTDGVIGEVAPDAFLVALEEEAKKLRTKRRRVRIAVGVYLAFIGFMLIIFIGGGLLTGRWSEFPWQFFQVFAYVNVFAAASYSATQRTAARELSKYDDIRSVGPLSTVLDGDDAEIRDAARTTLLRLLPRLKASDADLLTPEHHEHFHRFITNAKRRSDSKDSKLVVATIQAMEQVGVAADEHVVEKLTRITPSNAAETAVRDAALASLPAIRQRADLDRAAHTLLRPTQSPGEEAILLRPAGQTTTDDESKLLRPVSDDSNA